jgi:tRNA(Glu) U13 pseudouridine synthase TruD
MTDFLLQNSTLLAPIVQRLVGKGMYADVRTLIEEIENDAEQCKAQMSQVKERFTRHIKKSIDEINFPYEAAKEVVKLRIILDWVIFESGYCFRITRAELARYKVLF